MSDDSQVAADATKSAQPVEETTAAAPAEQHSDAMSAAEDATMTDAAQTINSDSAPAAAESDAAPTEDAASSPSSVVSPPSDAATASAAAAVAAASSEEAIAPPADSAAHNDDANHTSSSSTLHPVVSSAAGSVVTDVAGGEGESAMTDIAGATSATAAAAITAADSTDATAQAAASDHTEEDAHAADVSGHSSVAESESHPAAAPSDDAAASHTDDDGGDHDDAADESHAYLRHDVYMTSSQAASENKKLKLGCGWRWMPLEPVRVAALTVIDLAPRQPRRITKGGPHDDDEEMAAPATPAPRGKGRASLPPVAAATPKSSSKSSKSSRGGAAASPAVDPVDEKKRQLDALEERIAALRNEQMLLTERITADESSSAPSEKSSKKKRKSMPPTPVAIPPATPTAARTSSHQPATPSVPATPATPGLTRHGRNIKVPQQYTAAEEPPAAGAEQKLLRKCRILLDHLAGHKSAQGVFSSPVNYHDPNLPLFAPNYLQVIGDSNRPIDFGTIKAKLVAGGYADSQEFSTDVRMVYRNAMLYNPAGDWIHKAATDGLNLFEREIERIETGADAKRARTSHAAHQHHHAAAEDDEDQRAAKRAKQSRGSESLTQAELMQRIIALEERLKATPGGGGGIESPPFQPTAAPPAYRGPAAAPPVPAYKKPLGPPVKAQQPLTQREKQQLKEDIFKLPSHKLGPVVEIISKAMPKTEQKDDADEIEIDIDKLNIPTLRDLQAYVRKALAALKRNTKPAAPRRSTPSGGGTGPRSSPNTAAARATPAAASPSTLYPATAGVMSPARLETPSTPSNLARATSQAVGNTTPALKYDSSSDDSDSSSSDSDSDDDTPAYTSHIQAVHDDTPAILDMDTQNAHDSDSDDDVGAAWAAAASTAAAAPPAAGPTGGASSALWSDFQRSAAEAKEKARALVELERARSTALEAEKATLLANAAARKLQVAAEETERIAAEQRAIEEKAAKLAADRESARRAREARFNEAALAAPSGIAVMQEDIMDTLETMANQE